MPPEIRDAIQRHGYAFINEHAVGQESREAMARFGRLLTLPGLADVQTLELREKESATHWNASYRLVASLRPDCLVLRKLVGSRRFGITALQYHPENPISTVFLGRRSQLADGKRETKAPEKEAVHCRARPVSWVHHPIDSVSGPSSRSPARRHRVP